MKRIQFRLTAYTDAAGKRNDTPPLYGNEDNFFVDADLSNEQQGEFITDEQELLSDYGSLLVVADGMGGMNAGEIASDIAIQTVKKFFAKDRLTPDIVVTTKSREHYMEQVVAEADAAIKDHARKNRDCEGMGSTIILVWVCEGMASVTWCGDSRAYLFRDSTGICQISKDHSYVQSLVDDGKITEHEAFDHPYGNIITRSLGDPEKKAQADSKSIPVYREDVILVCSDGLSGVLRDRKSYDSSGQPRANDNLEDLIRANRSSMQQCREALWAAAERADWYDNVTAILYEITDGDDTLVSAEPGVMVQSELKVRSFIDIRIRIDKRRLRYFLVSLVIIAIVACGAFVAKKAFDKKSESDWQERYDQIRQQANEKGLNYIIGRLGELNQNDNEGLSVLDSMTMYRMDLLNRMDTIEADDTNYIIDSLRRIVCNDSAIDEKSIVVCIDSLYNAKTTELSSPITESQANKNVKSATPVSTQQKERHETDGIPNDEIMTPAEEAETEQAPNYELTETNPE